MGLIFLLFLGDINATRSEVEVYIKLSRQYLYHVTQSFFQSWLLGFLAYLTFWVDLEDFNDRYAICNTNTYLRQVSIYYLVDELHVHIIDYLKYTYLYILN